MSNLLTNDSLHIREVWNDNLDEEFKLIRNIVDAYPYVAMDTEFPGIVSQPEGHFENREDRNYQLLKTNVNQLKLIQVGLTFSDEKGNLPTCGTDKYCIWQFNFREFKKSEDKHAPDSIELLERSGIDFDKCSEKGVKASRFGELFTSSGVVMNDEVRCITFHGGMDLGYLLKILTGKCLPDTRAGFSELLQIYFPNLYDMKHLMRFGNGLYGGLKKLAETLGVQRIGTSHHAGSDSLLTSCTFMKLKGVLAIPIEKQAGVVFGLGEEG